MTARFDTLEDAARFCAAMVREGCTFNMAAAPGFSGQWIVTLTGGY